ncbi:hypothetical protein PoB_001564300 [Plakobranchus ocellatus]|uniref:Uncharacterized protein n=1 Tax=Plakobranchus ocellatus TaxID=259542 RepID=A0AAV3Z3T6_9GAST|nr:hypothetical protein PoB_001564300 [Plakobranchus ocellatus]
MGQACLMCLLFKPGCELAHPPASRNASLNLCLGALPSVKLHSVDRGVKAVSGVAFDKVRHVELFRMLEKLDIDGNDLRVIRDLSWDQAASVRIEGE